MLQKLIERRRKGSEEGFTLIELMVVVLIIAILIAIAIPTFLGARTKSQARVAQSNARNALTAEKTYFTDNEKYTETPADMTALEASLVYNTATNPAAAATPRDISLKLGPAADCGDQTVSVSGTD